MIRIGITGSIASGKSTVSKMFQMFGAAVFDADKVVHDLLSHDHTIQQKVISLLPQAWIDGAIHRPTLGSHIFHHPEKLKELEAILHPAVQKKEREFIKSCKRRGIKIAIFDIPLLFETKAHLRMDISILVSCPLFIQHQRALKRPHMTKEKLSAILAKQMPRHHKRKHADFEIHTGLGKAQSMKEIRVLLAKLGYLHA